MPLLQLVLILIVIGVIMWLVNTYGSRALASFVPMQASIKKVLNIVVLIVVILWLLSVFGLLSSFKTIHVGH